MKFLAFFIYYFLTATSDLLSNTYDVQPIQPGGILFEHIHSGKLYIHTWTILSKVTIPSFNEELKFINDSHITMEKICSSLNEAVISKPCFEFVQQIQRLAEGVRSLNEEMTHQTQARKKRGIFNGVGNLAKWLFGTMDNHDAEMLHNKIQNLESWENHTFSLLQDQIHVVRSTFNLMNESRIQATEERRMLLQNYKHLSSEIGWLQKSVTSLKRLSDASQLAQIIIAEIVKIKDYQTTILEIIDDLENGDLHPLILGARRLQKIYENISAIHDIDPVFAKYSILSQIITVQSVLVNNDYIIRINIPVPKNTQYEIYKLYVVPVRTGKTVTVLDVKIDIIAAHNSTQEYVELSKEDFKLCKQVLLDDLSFTYLTNSYLN